MGNFLTLYRRVSCVSVRDSVTRCLTFVQELLLAGDGRVAAGLPGPVAGGGVEHHSSLTHLEAQIPRYLKVFFFFNPIFIKWYFLYCLSRFYRFYVALPLQTVNYYIALKVSKKIFSLSRHRFIYTFLYR